ncbi:Y-family DNA polymerase [Sphingobacterium haloxyli]|uniref:Nucleotidyltransferase n=1 Tax=Sphingobacterium haloxyli TaxID=2100533 RepID=A0A2S9J4U0_9SPHI|nr:DNA polymerase Y family protein [Sphingobacterium haloxyli]PRD47772.1 nucleotidyltransferase [Sphingobacterium haloxyli]
MPKRYMCIWLPLLATDSIEKIRPELRSRPLVLSAPQNGRTVVTAANRRARAEGIVPGKVLADAKTILPELEALPDDPPSTAKLLESLAEWCLRFSPVAAVDVPDGIILDISGCAHLWGGERPYLDHIVGRFAKGGYGARVAIADTVGAAWALAHFGTQDAIAESGQESLVLEDLPPAALRLDPAVLARMEKLGFRRIGQFIQMPKSMLRRRFGDALLLRLGQAHGTEPEALEPVVPELPYQERLPCLEPIRTATGIEIALQTLLENLCSRLSKEGRGMRSGILKGYRVDGNIQQIHIGTSRASHNPEHLFGLFALKIPTIEPALGIELFVLEAPLVEEAPKPQEVLWETKGGRTQVAELLDTIAGKVGMDVIHRYLPQQHHWPERSIRATASLDEVPDTEWPVDKLRPLHLLSLPEPISVMVVLPDYPPMLFTHKGRTYKLAKAEGPERIEQEWWITDGRPRDYYRVEDEKGGRYWLFRSGHYGEGEPEWFLHGFFA